MRALLLLCLLAAPLMAQGTPDSVVKRETTRTVTIEVKDSAIVRYFTVVDTVRPDSQPDPEPEPDPSACAGGTAVTTAAQLKAAVANAQPGQVIRMLPGAYATGHWTISRNGTAAQPVTLCGPRDAVVSPGSGYIALSGDYWIFQGFTVRDGLSGFKASNADGNVFRGLLLEGFQSMALLLDGQSAGNVVEGNHCDKTGQVTATLGECFYIGSGNSSDVSDNNQILRNTFGPDVRAEHVQIRSGSNNLVQGNRGSARGFRYAAGNVTSVYWTAGRGNRFLDNVIEDMDAPQANAYATLGATNAVIRRNAVTGRFLAPGYRHISGGAGNVIGCDNRANGAAPSGCVP